jgi:hypothetical protein
MGMPQKICNAWCALPIPGEPYITRLIIEDKCWISKFIKNKALPNSKNLAAHVVNTE